MNRTSKTTTTTTPELAAKLRARRVGELVKREAERGSVWAAYREALGAKDPDLDEVLRLADELDVAPVDVELHVFVLAYHAGLKATEEHDRAVARDPLSVPEVRAEIDVQLAKSSRAFGGVDRLGLSTTYRAAASQRLQDLAIVEAHWSNLLGTTPSLLDLNQLAPMAPPADVAAEMRRLGLVPRKLHHVLIARERGEDPYAPDAPTYGSKPLMSRAI